MYVCRILAAGTAAARAEGEVAFAALHGIDLREKMKTITATTHTEQENSIELSVVKIAK